LRRFFAFPAVARRLQTAARMRTPRALERQKIGGNAPRPGIFNSLPGCNESPATNAAQLTRRVSETTDPCRLTESVLTEGNEEKEGFF